MKTVRHLLVTMLVCASISPLLRGFTFAQAQPQQSSGAQTDAATLYHIAEFVEWPQTNARKAASFNFCILGQDPFGGLLEDAVLGRTIGEKQTMILRANRVSDFGSCNVMFISSSETERLPKILPKLRDKNILTVGESADFAASGGILQLLKSGDRISFVINVDAAQRAGLTIRAQLLSLAKVVHQKELGPPADKPASRELR